MSDSLRELVFAAFAGLRQRQLIARLWPADDVQTSLASLFVLAVHASVLKISGERHQCFQGTCLVQIDQSRRNSRP
jgi:hypothetical protein